MICSYLIHLKRALVNFIKRAVEVLPRAIEVSVLINYDGCCLLLGFRGIDCS